MITYTSDLQTACLLFTVTRVDGELEYATTASVDITIGATTWQALPGLKAGLKTSRLDGTPPTMGFQAQFGTTAPFKFADAVQGKYDGARVQVYLTDWNNPTVAEFVFDGLIMGEVAYDQHGTAAFDLISSYAMPRDIFVQKYTLMCRHQFGDWKYCKVPVFPVSEFPLANDRLLRDVERGEGVAAGSARRYRFGVAGTPEDYSNVYLEANTTGITSGSAPAFSATPGTVTVDGTVTFTTRESYARAAQIVDVDNHSITLDRVPDARWATTLIPERLKFYFATGEYTGRAFKGAGWDAGTKTLETYLPCPFAAVGDWIEIAGECNKTLEQCHGYYNNARLHGGFPNQQGAKAQMQQLGYPA